ncbi:hypothetical protein [Sphingomonas radiodurans]|uniref:hypothetical protein n=1 Tax=Sphingomonas radiodurans TaxID=2890321 RepID=UPI001E32454E|nr:hypothetical protein [Sphingomonas radiodurans]WBH16302.1 hypothetical protein LLW23_16105 [Sphingomonas radiodurans]
MVPKLLTGLAASALVVAPVAASAAPAANAASKLSVSKSVRASTPTSKKDRAAGNSVIPILIGAGVVAGVAYLIIDNENDDDSDSN